MISSILFILIKAETKTLISPYKRPLKNKYNTFYTNIPLHGLKIKRGKNFKLLFSLYPKYTLIY